MRNAKIYQSEASGNAALEFRKGNAGWDDINEVGSFVDRKWGHGGSIFKYDQDVFGQELIIAHNQNRVNGILSSATRQVENAEGSKILWEIETELGAKGIKQIFANSSNSLIREIEVKWVEHIALKN